MYKNLDLSALSIDDIVEEYKLLHGRHEQLKERCEADAQRIHELKRSLETSLAAEKYLTQELEQYNAQAQVACPSSELRLQQELDELRRKYRSLQLEHETLQQDHDAKSEETHSLKSKLEATARELESSVALKVNSAHDECANRLTAVEQENAELMLKLADYEDAKVQNTFAVAEQEKTIEILKDQVSCLEENLRGKRDELEEKLQLLESSQEQLVDANAKIAMLSSAPEQNDRKGNSLFAEVDDQRQAMKHLLASQKKSYLDMKKIFNESKSEIHRLKRENIAMHTELQACSTIFCSADKTYQNKLNERIRQLLVQNVKLEHNLNVSQERLRDLASQKSVTWLDSMLDFCKRETDELKTQLHSMHIQKATIEEQLRNVQQEMARWRFESLKSRCVLIDRENLLTEHKIAFKQVKVMEFNIREAELNAALPRIVSALPTCPIAASSPLNVMDASEVISLVTPLKVKLESTSEVLVLDTPLKIEPQESTNDVKQELPEREEQATAIEQEMQCKMELTELTAVVQQPIVAKPIKKGTPVKQRMGLIKVKAEQELLSEEHQAAELLVASKPNRKGTPVKFAQLKTEQAEDEEAMHSPAKPQRKGTPVKMNEDLEIESKAVRKPTPMKISSEEKSPIQEVTNNNVRSIMSKKRDLFAEDNHKNVQFSSSDPIVHNLSPDVCSPVESHKENAQPAGKNIKPPQKSQNIIRRIVVAPKNSGFSLK
ncbi:hypothetical protein KR093_011102 [Drosophila rubida]|uniref:Protein Spindly n=1 Tax=Drosophila rubida TaxID=30044 RepID=A0AAD4K6K3_9MUSC|nr:hypothetical protein KR093_011102 [Drosophila rubida]